MDLLLLRLDNSIPNSENDGRMYPAGQVSKRGFSIRIGSRLDLLYRLVRACSYFTDSIDMSVDSDGILCRVLDPSHILMIDFHLGKLTFENHSVETPPVNITLNSDDFLTVLSRGSRTAKKVELYMEDIGSEIIHIIFEGNKESEYLLDCNEFTSPFPPVPRVDFKASIRLSTSLLKEVLEDVKIISDKVEIRANQNMISFLAKSDKRQVSCSLGTSMSQVYNVSCPQNCVSRFDLIYLLNFLESLKPSIVDLELADNAPLRITEYLVSGNYDLGYISMYLAPYVGD